MEIVTQLIAAAVGVALLAIAIAHLLWSVGIMWPIRDEKLLARSVVGRPGIERMPAKYLSFGVALLTFAACVIAFSAADHASGGAPLTFLALLAGLIFLARGIVGYTKWWATLTPEEPFRTFDRKTYSPLCLALGLGFLILVAMRLI
ncbi:MAG: DUF3995 domain-containing protein [Devosia sp.]|nr:DUF3995 domain-containing protein [Devosia sp.]